MQAHVSDSLQGVVPSDGCYCGIIDGAWNRIENDVENHQEDDPSKSNAGLFWLTVHCETSLLASDAFLLINPSGFTH